ncbi:MAG: hypothetical protein ACP5E4_02265, partial [Candidatus Aenigmatarchaeota archaeon]
YGYIFEPDLPVIEVGEEMLNKVESNLPELPDMKKKRFMKLKNVSEEMINTLLTEPEMANYFEYLCETHNEKASAVILAKYLKKTLNYHNLLLRDTGIDIRDLRRILDLLQDYLITDDVAEIILQEMVYDVVKGKKPRGPDQIMRDLDYEKPLDEEHLRRVIHDAIRENAKAVRDYQSGQEEAFNYLLGQVMNKTGRRIQSGKIREMLKVELD